MAALQSSVSAVIVFQRGATVTRTATAEPAAGTHAFEGLPLCIDDESVRIELGPDAAAAGWSVTDVQVDVDAPEPAPVAEPEDDRDFAEAVDARERAKARLAATEASMQALRDVELERRGSEDLKRRPTHDPTEGRLAWLELRAQSLTGLREAMVRERELLEQAEQALRALKDARAARSSDRDPRAFEPRKRVTLRLAAGEGADAIPIALSYRVPGARWAPSYVLRLGEEGRATLALRAVVAQRTGEDWASAKLTVSTASWQAWHDLPRLDALRVGRSQPPVARAGWREPPPDPEGLYADYDRFASSLEERPVAVMAAAEEPAPAAVRRRASAAKPTKKRAPRATVPPPPQAAAMAPPPPRPTMPMPAPESKSASLLGSLFDSGGAVSEEASAAMPLADEDDFMVAGAPPPEPEPAHGLGRQWFDYGRLRLPLPTESGRGRLRREPSTLSSAVQQAQRRAAQLMGDALPDGHAWIQSRPGHAYAYVCEGAIDIPSDGQGHVVNVLETPVEASRNHVCVPGISSDVFRTLAARNPLSVPLPAGPLDVYERETFLLTGSIDGTGSGARFEVGLGVEQSIKVARNVEFAEESEGLIKRSNAYAHRIVVDVQNLLPTPASIEIRERIPVPASDEDDINVTESAADPPWDVYTPKDDPLEGGRRWQLEVSAGAKTTLRAAYTVRVPGGMQLVGGNRREA